MEEYICPYENILPTYIGGINFQKLNWQAFQGQPDQNSNFWAFTYCETNYKYEYSKNNEILTDLNFQFVTNKSWVRHQTPKLLTHEIGHYIISGIQALEFKKQAQQNSQGEQIKTIFDRVNQQEHYFHEQYDKETNHSQNQEIQLKWNSLLIEKFLFQKGYFENKIQNPSKQAQNKGEYCNIENQINLPSKQIQNKDDCCNIF